MNISQTKNYDVLVNLPTDDETQLSETEVEILNALFKEHKTTINSVINETYEPLVVGILFIIFSLEHVDRAINYASPITSNSIYFLMIAKTALIMISFWIIKYFHLSGKN